MTTFNKGGGFLSTGISVFDGDVPWLEGGAGDAPLWSSGQFFIFLAQYFFSFGRNGASLTATPQNATSSCEVAPGRFLPDSPRGHLYLKENEVSCFC